MSNEKSYNRHDKHNWLILSIVRIFLKWNNSYAITIQTRELLRKKEINYKAKLTLWQIQRAEERKKRKAASWFACTALSELIPNIKPYIRGCGQNPGSIHNTASIGKQELSILLTWAMVKVPGEPDITQHHSALSLEQDFQQVFQLPLSETQQTLIIGKGWPPHPSSIQWYSQHNPGFKTNTKI